MQTEARELSPIRLGSIAAFYPEADAERSQAAAASITR